MELGALVYLGGVFVFISLVSWCVCLKTMCFWGVWNLCGVDFGDCSRGVGGHVYVSV